MVSDTFIKTLHDTFVIHFMNNEGCKENCILISCLKDKNYTQWNLVCFPKQEEMYIFMEYCDEGTLEEVSKLGLQEHVIRLYSKQITIAINVLHEHGIVHRDIKGNVNQKGSVVSVL